MPLPTQVVEKLSQEQVKTPGWSGGILMYAGALFLLVAGLYFGIKLVYEPILKSQVSAAEGQINKLGQTVSSADQAKIITYYSQISNLRNLIKNHTLFTPFLNWLESHTEANVSYNTFSYSSGGQIGLAGIAPSQSDIAEQIAIFQNDSEVKDVLLSAVNFAPATNEWQFNVSLVMQPKIFQASGQ